jgi:uncharacterized protein (TIGR03083 family)
MGERGVRLAGAERLLRDQWELLRSWVETERVLARGAEPSGLGAWTLRDLVVHLGYGLHMVAEVGAAPGERPISIATYVAGYRPASARIAADTATESAGMGKDVLGGVDRLVDDAWRALAAGMPDVVRGRRGVLTREDFLGTRLIELVVHGDDMHRVLGPERPSPLRAAAVDEVASVLARGYATRTGGRPGARGLDLVREATGRTASRDPAMPLLS